MDQKDIGYTELDENAIRATFTGTNLKNIPVYIIFDEDGDPTVALKCWEIATVKNNKLANGLLICNKLNDKYRWVKFYIDKDNDIVGEMDAIIDEESCGSEVMGLIERLILVIDEGYPAIMQALLS